MPRKPLTDTDKKPLQERFYKTEGPDLIFLKRQPGNDFIATYENEDQSEFIKQDYTKTFRRVSKSYAQKRRDELISQSKETKGRKRFFNLSARASWIDKNLKRLARNREAEGRTRSTPSL